MRAEERAAVQDSSEEIPVEAAPAAAAEPASRPDPLRHLTLWLFLLLFGVYVTTTRGHFWSNDEISVYQQTRSLWSHGDLDTSPLLNTLPGRGGRHYAVYGPGQSVLALPFYTLGRIVHDVLEWTGARSWLEVLAGPVIGAPAAAQWGGAVEIFFVNLFNAVVVALLGIVWFRFQLRLGVAPKWALAATLILALATHLTGFAGGFFQHGAESLFVLESFYLLFCDSAAPRLQTRFAAGTAAGAMLLVRVNTAVLLPALTLYLAFHAWKRRPEEPVSGRLAGVARECLPFLLSIGAALLVVGGVNAWKFGEFGLRGGYAKLVPFSTPLLLGLYGNLFSVGSSIFLFSPILFLAPAYFRRFVRQRPVETAAILGIAASSLLLYSKVYLWHGQWAFGPRYLVHLVPLLLLPLGTWLQESAAWKRMAVLPLALAGLLVAVLHVAMNVSYVFYREGYTNLPGYEYLFLPEKSQLAAHWRALVAWDNRVDLWLVEVWRRQGATAFVPIGVSLLWFLSWSVRQVKYYLAEAESNVEVPEREHLQLF